MNSFPLFDIQNIFYPTFGSLIKDRAFQDFKNFRYGYQGSEKDDEINGKGNSYTTEFRGLDTRLGRWLSIDPKMNSWDTPYSSMGNNPIWHNDIWGDEFDEKSKPAAKTYETKLDKKIEGIATLIGEKQKALKDLTGGAYKKLNKEIKQLQNQESELTVAKSEFVSLKTSKQVFSLEFKSIGKESSTTYNPSTKKVEFHIGTENDGFSTIGHEFKHGFQFLQGKTSFDRPSGKVGGDLYNQTDEIDAYKRQYSLDQDYTKALIKKKTGNTITNESQINYGLMNDLRYNKLQPSEQKTYETTTDFKVDLPNKIE